MAEKGNQTGAFDTSAPHVGDVLADIRLTTGAEDAVEADRSSHEHLQIRQTLQMSFRHVREREGRVVEALVEGAPANAGD